MSASVELPQLNEKLCTGCESCVTVCPTNCLAMGRRYPWIPRPGDCTSCAACTLVCPTDALTFPDEREA